MSTEFINDQWRLPNEENKSKVSNYSMDFDGSSDFIDLGTSFNSMLELGNSFSISAWVNFNNTSSDRTIISNTTNSNTGIQIRVKPDESIRIILVESASIFLFVDSSPLAIDTWHHIVCTYDGSGTVAGLNLYINSSLDNNNTGGGGTISTITSTDSLRIGKHKSTQPLYFNGQIDQVSVFDYELSATQVSTLYGGGTAVTNPMSLSPKPVAYYPLGDQDSFNGSSYLTPNASLKDYVFDFIPNDYIDLGNNVFFNTNNPFSFSTWVNLDSYSDPYPYLANLKTNVTDGIGIFISNNSSYSGVNVGSTDSSITKGKTTGDISGTFLNSWNQVVVTYNGNGANTLSNFLIYVNGSPVTLTSTGTFGTMPNTANNIGRRSNSYHYLDGKMSNVQIFNTALPATGSNSIETLYNNGSPLTSMTGFTSLQGWWKLDASATYDSSTNTWTIPDDSTNSNDGTSSGMTQANLVQSDLSFTSGYSPYALDFDSASTSYVNVGNNSSINSLNQITGSVWAKFTGTSNDVYAVFANWGSSTKFSFEYQKTTSTNSRNIRLRINYGNNTKSSYFITYADLSDDNWHHLVFTIDGTTNANGINIYVDGAKLSSFTATNTGLYNSSVDTLIGSRYTNSTWDMEGPISNVSVWNTDLTSAQVTEIYNEGVPSNLNNHSAYSNLVSWWQLGSNSSFNTNWTVLDEKGSNNGTSVNMDEDAIVDGVGSYANGLSSGMGGDEVIGDAPYSSSNSLSVNMDVEDRVTDTPS